MPSYTLIKKEKALKKIKETGAEGYTYTVSFKADNGKTTTQQCFVDNSKKIDDVLSLVANNWEAVQPKEVTGDPLDIEDPQFEVFAVKEVKVKKKA